MIAATDTDPLPRLRDQVAHFKADVDAARSRLDALVAADRSPVEPVRHRAAEDNVERAEAGLRNSLRILREAEAAWETVP